MRSTSFGLATAGVVLLLASVACIGRDPVLPPDDTTPGADTTPTVTGRANPQAGEYAKQHGFEVPSLALGTGSFQLRQTHASGRQDRSGHSSDYLPIYQGPLASKHDASVAGIALGLVNKCDIFRDAIRQAALADLPTSEKFDRAVEAITGVDPGFTAYYLDNHFDPYAAPWEGLCHNWAPAGVLEPIAELVWSSDLIVGDQPTGIGDFRELVTATLPSPRTYFLGRRNNTNLDEDEATDLDLADVVAALKYAIQDHDYGIVFDVTATAEVWNQPVDHYTQTVTEATGDAALAGLVPTGGAAKRVSLTIPYAVEATYAHRGDTHTRTMQLDGYLIEDAAGRVVDSKWITPTRDHPDFMWVPTGLYYRQVFNMLEALYHHGTRMEDVAAAAELCDTIADFAQVLGQGGTPSQADQQTARQSVAAAAKVIDGQKLDSLIHSTANSANIDPGRLSAAVKGS